MLKEGVIYKLNELLHHSQRKYRMKDDIHNVLCQLFERRLHQACLSLYLHMSRSKGVRPCWEQDMNCFSLQRDTQRHQGMLFFVIRIDHECISYELG